MWIIDLDVLVLV